SVGCVDDAQPGSQERREAYSCDIVYGTNNEFGFDYLRDNMASTKEDCVQKELNFAIIDEIDNILIDEARTPLIISGPVTKTNEEYDELKPRVIKLVNVQKKLISSMVKEVEQEIDKEGVTYEACKKLLTVKRGDPKNKNLLELQKREGVAKQMKMVEADYLREKKLHLLEEDLYYSIDESGNSADMTDKGFNLLSGDETSFFVVPELSEEIKSIDSDDSLSESEKAAKRDEVHRIYAERTSRIHSVSQLLRAYSVFEKDVDYVVQDGQIMIVDEFTGRILSGRRYSEGLHQALESKEGVKVAGENQTLATITFQNFFKMYNKVSGMTGTAITEAGEFNEIYELDVVQIPTNRPLIRDDKNDEIYRTQREKYNAVVDQIRRAVENGNPSLVGTISIEKSEYLSRLLSKEGIDHEVLNAKQHEREAAIIAQAGRKGAVTIATNMAGRGTDIVLGGNFEELARQKIEQSGEDPKEYSREELNKKFPELAKELEQEHKDVVEAGGLCIIGTERHESRRIDNQLRGRAGRQGDPGMSKFYLSLDDDLMRIFGSERISNVMDRLGAEEGEVISHPLVTRAIGNAQQKVEGRNFEIRKHLKEYDDVMTHQRNEIYSLRNSILHNDNIREETLEQIATWIEEEILKHTGEDETSETELSELRNSVEAKCGVTIDIPEDKKDRISPEELFDIIWEKVEERYKEREEIFGNDQMREFERGVSLMVIDSLWKDHLYEMDNLKEGVRYRAYGQKNPLYEYQREGKEMFATLREKIAEQITGYMFTLKEVDENTDRMGVENSKTVHSDINVYSSEGAQKARDQRRDAAMSANRDKKEKKVPVKVGPKIGRNEPCPCGSGKKYKKCCGKK
ncbi:MAG: preprotein translocase subunit SecA, partial [Chitinivibrionales bacterium]